MFYHNIAELPVDDAMVSMKQVALVTASKPAAAAAAAVVAR